jgi:hypothetical protein
MLRSIAAGRERRRFHSRSALRCVSKHEGTPSHVLILRDARTRLRVCGASSACALLRMRTSIAYCRTHDLKQHTLPRSRAAFLHPSFASLLHSPRIERWAERRETFGSCAKHPWGVPSCVKDACERAFAAARAGWSDPCIFLFFCRFGSSIPGSHDLKQHALPRSRGACLRPGFAFVLHSPRMRGGRSAERRSGARRNTRGACT